MCSWVENLVHKSLAHRLETIITLLRALL
jgi:hypothetical protein